MQSFIPSRLYEDKKQEKTVMQKRHKDRQTYFKELANTSRRFYVDYVKRFMRLDAETRVLEIGCGEGGNLLPFAELGCRVTGIDLAKSRILQARAFFSACGYEGDFSNTDFFDFSPGVRYQLILIHDVIEHIGRKEEFFRRLRWLLAEGGIIFWGFPSWQMPFGGHQQICHGKVVAWLPFIHLLPDPLYRIVLKGWGESESCIEDLMDIKRCRMSIDSFEQLSRQQGYDIVDRQLWFINPHYREKFGLRPRKLYAVVGRMRYVRSFFSTACFYITR